MFTAHSPIPGMYRSSFHFENDAKADTPGTGSASTPPPTGGVDQKAFEKMKAELAAAQERLTVADKRWENTQAVLIKGINAETEGQARQMFKDAGYNDVQIEQQMAMLRGDGGEEGGGEEEEQRPAPRGRGRREEAEGDAGESEWRKNAEAQIRDLQQRLNGQAADKLQAQLDSEIGAAIAADKDLSRVLNAVKEKDPEKYQELRRQIEGEVEGMSKQKLTRLRDVTGRVDPTKFSVYAKESVASVSGKFRSVIDAVAPLGRSSETDSGIAAFLESAPVKLSTKPTGGDAVEEVTAFMADSLTRALYNGNGGSRA